MDWLKIALSFYLILLVINAAASVLMIGRPREAITPGGAGCSVLVSFAVFVTLLLVWQRL